MTSRYLELADLLEADYHLNRQKRTREAAEAIRELLSLVGKIREAMEFLPEMLMEGNDHWPDDHPIAVNAGHTWGALCTFGDIRKIDALLQKAREATGEAESSPASLEQEMDSGRHGQTPEGEPKPEIPHNALSDAKALRDWYLDRMAGQ